MPKAGEFVTQPMLLMLVDISGYTRFMVGHGKELRHSETIVRELLESLIAQVDVPLRAYPGWSAGTRFLTAKGSLVIRRGRDRGSCGS